jgi:chromosome segregation ATPase
MSEQILEQILNQLKRMEENIHELKTGQQNLEMTLQHMEIGQQRIKIDVKEIKNILTSQVPRTYESYEKHMELQDKKISILNDRIFNIESRLQA